MEIFKLISKSGNYFLFFCLTVCCGCCPGLHEKFFSVKTWVPWHDGARTLSIASLSSYGCYMYQCLKCFPCAFSSGGSVTDIIRLQQCRKDELGRYVSER